MADTESPTEPSHKPVTTADSTSPIILRSPLKYHSAISSTSTSTSASTSTTQFTAPPPEWLVRSWSVTHSTLPMWRKAKNVRIIYTLRTDNSSSAGGTASYDDEVCSEPTERTLLPQPKSIKGVCTPVGEAAWDWRGKGWLKIATSHWEVLGWGERDGERWVVTWFAPSLFTPAGLDVYWAGEGEGDGQRRSISKGLYDEIMKGLEGLEAEEVADLAKRDMKEVKCD